MTEANNINLETDKEENGITKETPPTKILRVHKKIDYYERVVIMQCGTHIPIDEISGIEGEIFNQLDGEMIQKEIRKAKYNYFGTR